MKHALVIEDNHLIAMMIEEELVEHGYAFVEITTSQQQAIEMATARRPNLITVDDKLDSGSGVEAVREICRGQAIPVVFIAAEPDAIRLSLPDAIIVPKPFARLQLVGAIKAAIHAPMTC